MSGIYPEVPAFERLRCFRVRFEAVLLRRSAFVDSEPQFMKDIRQKTFREPT